MFGAFNFFNVHPYYIKKIIKLSSRVYLKSIHIYKIGFKVQTQQQCVYYNKQCLFIIITKYMMMIHAVEDNVCEMRQIHRARASS